MNLDELRARKAELDSTILQLASQWQTCQGHLGEVMHWIAQHERALAEVALPGVAQENLPVLD